MHRQEKRMLLRHYLEQGVPKRALARQLGVSHDTVYRWIKAGELDRDVDSERRPATGRDPRYPRSSTPSRRLSRPG